MKAARPGWRTPSPGWTDAVEDAISASVSRRWFAPILVGSLVVLGSGCALFQAFLGGKRPELTFRDVRLTSWSLDSVDLELVYELSNPYDVALTLHEVAYQLEVEGRRIASGKPKKGLSIRGRGKQILRFPATVHFLDVVPVVTELFSKKSLSYRASGSLGVKTPLGIVALPLSRSGSIAVPRLPKVEITDLSSPRITASGAEFSLGLRILNDNEFPVSLDVLEWSFLVDRASLASGKVGQTAVGGGGAREVRIPIRIGLAGASQAVQRLVSGQQTSVALTGNLRSGRVVAPIDARRLLRAGSR